MEPLPYYVAMSAGEIPFWRWEKGNTWHPKQCVFCGGTLSRVDDPRAEDGRFLPGKHGQVLTCSCGWWCASHVYDISSDFFRPLVVGLLRTFASSAAELPLTVLREEIRQSAVAATTVEPRKFQRLVQSILRDVWQCEIIDLGTTRDGGVDLLALRGNDNVVAIQVKRRASPEKAERIEVVREFLGAALLRGYKRLVLLSSAVRFTRGARDEARTAVDRRLVRKFELIDRGGLHEIASVLPDHPPWRVALTPDLTYAEAARSGINPKFVAVMPDPELTRAALHAIPGLREFVLDYKGDPLWPSIRVP